MSSLIIVGAGRLGTKVGELWHGPVTAETQTPRRHPELVARGWAARIRSDKDKFDNVLMTVPPSAGGDYEGEARRAVKLWSGKGQFVFVSSTVVYKEEGGGEVVETSAVSDEERAKVILAAEAVVLAAKGNVVRLAGLYDETSGPQMVYAAKKVSPLRGDAWINLIHRDDAASLVSTVLHSKKKGQTYLGTDGHPLLRCQLNAHCEFTGSTGPLGKKLNGKWTCKQLNWAPTKRH